MKLHGNLYDLKNGWYQGYLYNVLACDGLTMDGHYTILFNKNFDILAYKHGDYANLVSYHKVEFKGFDKLNERDIAYLKERVVSEMNRRKPYPEGRYSQAIFDYDFELHGIPVYFSSLPINK